MSSYSDYANAASDILLKKGSALAGAKERSGELIGSTIANLGQVVPVQVQQAIQQNAQRRKTAQIQSIIQQNGGDLDKALPLIMGVDATIGAHLADEHAKVQKSVAEVQEIKNKAQKEQLDFSDRLWSGVNDEGSYARAALVSHQLGEQVPDQYDPEWVKQKKQSLLSMKDQLDLQKPVVVGNNLVTQQGNVLFSGEPKNPPQPTEASLAADLSSPDPEVRQRAQVALDRLKPQGDKGITPFQAEELKMREKEFGLAQQRLALAIKNSNKPAISKETGGLVDAVIANPVLWGQLTPTAKAAIAPELQAKGFTAFNKPPSATVENRLASAQAVQQTGQDIISQLNDPKIRAMVGPAMGRFNSLRDFIGNPPPELSELAGSIESFALANMGVHGMRSVQGADEIKQLLDRKHTPDSLIKTIQGLNKFSEHFMTNEGRAPTSGKSDPLGIR